MTRHPFNPGELGADDSSLTELADELERSATTAAQPSVGFAGRVLAAIDDEPAPRRPWYVALGFGAAAPVVRGAALGAVGVAAILVAVLVGGLLGPVRPGPGSDGSPTPTASPTSSPTPSASASPSPTPTATPSASPTFNRGTPEPAETVPATESTGAAETPEPSDDHGGSGSAEDGGGESESPSPS